MPEPKEEERQEPEPKEEERQEPDAEMNPSERVKMKRHTRPKETKTPKEPGDRSVPGKVNHNSS